MPRKLGNVARSVLVNAPLPVATSTYTVISHQFVINTIQQELANNGFGIKHELYKCTTDAKEAIGKFIVDYNDDPDLSMMYAFVNSYNKMIKFGATFGVYVHESESFMVGQLGDWVRKHTGTADQETADKISEQMANAKDYYDELAQNKKAMQQIDIDADKFGSLLGKFLMKGWLTIDMVSAAVKEYNNPTYSYSTSKDNLWTCYNHILVALRQSNPRTWLANQSAIHLHMCLEFDLTQFDEDDATLANVCEETGITQEEDMEMNNRIEEYSDILLPQDGMSQCPEPLSPCAAHDLETEKEDDSVNDTPEITGIPNGNTMSDTDDEELTQKEKEKAAIHAKNPENVWPEGKTKVRAILDNDVDAMKPVKEASDLDTEEDEDWDKMGMVAIEPAGDEDHVDGVDELPNPNTEVTTVEDEVKDLQFIPTPDEDEIITQDDMTYISVDEYPGVQIGDLVDIDGMYFEVVNIENMEGDDYFGIKAVTMEEEEPAQSEEEHVGPPEMYTGDTIASTDTPFDMEESDEEEIVVEESNSVTHTNDSEEGVKVVIAKEIQELYGYNPEFIFVRKDDVYDVTLESGESFVLAANYINSMVNN